MLKLFVGYDPREAAVFHVFNQSVIDTCSVPVSITPLHQKSLQFDGQQDGTNAFIYSRYLVPYLMNFEGWAIFCDGDMILRDDLSKIWLEREDQYAVQVVKHDYKTKEHTKYIGTPLENRNVDYPRKNWSSVMLWNCGHPANKILTKEFVAEAGGAALHRFQFLKDEEIGEISHQWNHLVREHGFDPLARLVHWTLGAPGFAYYCRDDYCREWNYHLMKALHMEGERPEEMLRRAKWREVA